MEEPKIQPPFSRDVFLEWRAPRRGKAGPEELTNPVWVWLIESETSSYALNEAMDGPSSFGFQPCWSAERFGQSRSELPDGRVLEIAGEHEDYYDPDFFIYNDVFIHHPDGRIEIFGYGEDVFPPTDFHSATLVGEEVWLIGNLSYEAVRRPGETQVLVLSTETLEIRAETTTGENPGWIYRHEATLGEDGRSILVSGGIVDDGTDLIEKFDDWKLDLETLRWTRLTEVNWPHWILTRTDGKMNGLWEARQLEWDRNFGESLDDELKSMLEESSGEMDLDLLASLYQPPVDHVAIPREEDDEYNHYWVEIDGVRIRYVEDSHQVSFLVQGELPEELISALVEDLREKLSRLEQVPYEARALTGM